MSNVGVRVKTEKMWCTKAMELSANRETSNNSPAFSREITNNHNNLGESLWTHIHEFGSSYFWEIKQSWQQCSWAVSHIAVAHLLWDECDQIMAHLCQPHKSRYESLRKWWYPKSLVPNARTEYSGTYRTW